MRALILAALLTTPAFADEEIDTIVLSNAEHTLWHEAAHLLISELDLPVIGQEEDAADSFATLLMLDDEGEDRAERLLDVAELWIVSHERNEAEGLAPAYYDEHDLDAQRGLRVICFLAAEVPGRAEELVEVWGLPEERAETCAFDYEQAVDGWDVLLDPHMRDVNASPGQSVTVQYGRGGDWEALLREAQLLEFVAGTLDANFVLDVGLTIEAATCGEDNAFWDPETRTVTLCYEILDDYEALARQAVATRG
ncbi:MAG: DUF4344 domain-containing metallopeptidase [Paracoccaceae bacterium]